MANLPTTETPVRLSPPVTDDRAHQLVRLYEQAKQMRSTWEGHWQELSDRVLPRMSNVWFGNAAMGGTKNTNKMLDAGAAKGAERFASAMESLLSPRGSRWHKLRASDKALMKSLRVQGYFDDLCDVLFQQRYSTHANYATNQYESYLSMGVLGTGQYRIEKPREKGERGLRYGPLPLNQVYYLEDYQGRIRTVVRAFKYSAQQAVDMFGLDKLPEKIRLEFAKPVGQRSERPDFEFIQIIMPNRAHQPGAPGPRGMKFSSEYVSIEGKQVVETGGYRTWPIPINRYVTTAGEVYGRSPAMLALPAIKTLNEEKRIVLEAGHLNIRPVTLIPDDGVLDTFDFTPGSMVAGGVSPQGQPLVHAYNGQGRVDIGLELMEIERKDIDDIFLVTLFQILTDNPQMTATEVMERVREKGALLAPTAGRQMSEAQGPQIEREIDLLAEQGLLPQMPPELIEAEGEYTVEYESPLARMQKAEEVTGLTRTMAILMPWVEATQDPSPLLRFNMDAAVPDIAWANSVPARWQHSDEEVQQMKDAQAQKQQIDQAVNAAPAIAGLVKAAGPTPGAR